jgi:hypothetical protein
MIEGIKTANLVNVNKNIILSLLNKFRDSFVKLNVILKFVLLVEHMPK